MNVLQSFYRTDFFLKILLWQVSSSKAGIFTYQKQFGDGDMTHSVMLVPAGKVQGIFPASLGLVKALKDKGTKVSLFRPFAQCGADVCEGKELCKECSLT